MEMLAEGYLISDDKALLQFDAICGLLANSYWAMDRPKEAIRKSIDNSVCFGVYGQGVQVGFARVVTDFATVYYLADVIIGEAHREKGLGKALVRGITEDPRFRPLYGILATRDAHGLYEQFGFAKDGERLMKRPRPKVDVGGIDPVSP